MAELKAELKPGNGGPKKGGEVRLVVPASGRDVEVILPGRWDVSPAAAGRISTVAGVREVSEV